MIKITKLREGQDSFGFREAYELAKRIGVGEIYFSKEKKYEPSENNGLIRKIEFISLKEADLSDRNNGLIFEVEIYRDSKDKYSAKLSSLLIVSLNKNSGFFTI